MSKENILIVDDEEDVLELVRYNLYKNGYRLHTATSGEDALIKARAKMPDLIILDLMLPGIDGLEVCRRIKSDPKYNKLKIVMYTGLLEDNLKERSFEAGADEFIKKPITRDKLFQTLRKIFNKY